MKPIFFLILIILTSSIVSAVHLTPVPINISFSIDFQGERDFRLLMENGFERHFYWNENQTHSDASFEHTFYRNLDEDEFCIYTKQNADDFKNISIRMTDMLSTCSDIAGNLNKTDDYIIQLEKASGDAREYEMMWNVCEKDRKDAVNKSKEYETDYNTYKSNYEECNSNVINLRSSNSGYQSCKDDLQTAEKSKTNMMIIFLGIGIGIGYFVWGKKKNMGPSEQTDRGPSSDAVDYERYFKDGPRQ